MKEKCVKCKELFSRDLIFTVPSEWNYDVKICKECYRKVKGE